MPDILKPTATEFSTSNLEHKKNDNVKTTTEKVTEKSKENRTPIDKTQEINEDVSVTQQAINVPSVAETAKVIESKSM